MPLWEMRPQPFPSFQLCSLLVFNFSSPLEWARIPPNYPCLSQKATKGSIILQSCLITCFLHICSPTFLSPSPIPCSLLDFRRFSLYSLPSISLPFFQHGYHITSQPSLPSSSSYLLLSNLFSSQLLR